jgi:putative flippase GtrA
MRPDLATQEYQGWMRAASELAHRLHLPTTLIKFLMVGGMGFVIYQFLLFVFYTLPTLPFLPDKETKIDPLPFGLPELGLRLLIVSIVALEAAIVFQFSSHERWTFRNRNRAGWVLIRFLKFNLNSSFAIIAILVMTNLLSAVLGVMNVGLGPATIDVSPYIASFVGVLIGFVWNWTMNSLVIWPKERAATILIETEDADPRPA